MGLGGGKDKGLGPLARIRVLSTGEKNGWYLTGKGEGRFWTHGPLGLRFGHINIERGRTDAHGT